MASKESSLYSPLESSVLSHFSPIVSGEESHLAHLNQSPIATASYHGYVVQGIMSSLKVMSILFTFFTGGKKNKINFLCFSPKRENDLSLQKNILAAPLTLRSQVLTALIEELCKQTSSSHCCKTGMLHFVLFT